MGLRLLLGVVFVYAAWTKLREPWLLFAMAIDGYGVLPHWAVLTVARTLPWAELALGLLLLSGKWQRVSASAAAGILSVFFVLMVRTYLQGLSIECGCFGSGDPISPRTLARDGLLLACAAMLAIAAFRRPCEVLSATPETPPVKA